MQVAQTIASQKMAGSTDGFSVSELAEMLGPHPSTIRMWVREDVWRQPARTAAGT
jgi:uncharacterized protein YjcR